MKTFIGQNIQNKSNSIFKIQALIFNGIHPFFSKFLECLVKPLFIYGSKKILQPQLPCLLQIETFLQQRNWAIE
jgi:hypothetical protein